MPTFGNRRESPSDSNHGQVDAVSRDRQRQQQLSVQLPYITKIETIGYDHNSDDIHLTTAGQLALDPVIAAALPAP
jgi:hypothetical protein